MSQRVTKGGKVYNVFKFSLDPDRDRFLMEFLLELNKRDRGSFITSGCWLYYRLRRYLIDYIEEGHHLDLFSRYGDIDIEFIFRKIGHELSQELLTYCAKCKKCDYLTGEGKEVLERICIKCEEEEVRDNG